MSQWAHIAGVIRFNDIRCLNDPHPRTFLGNTCSFSDNRETWDKCNVPCGSEGSLQYKVIENPDESCLAAYDVIFYGDLRDKGLEIIEEMLEYLNRISKNQNIRQGIMQVEIETEGVKIFSYHHDGGWQIT